MTPELDQPEPDQPKPAGPEPAQAVSRPRRLLLLADFVHPFVYRENFPQGVPEVDLVLVAGDVPGYYLEFIATKMRVPVVYVPGNHANEFVNEGDGKVREPRGVMNAHGKIVKVAGLRIAGWGGVPRYREGGSGQYGRFEAKVGLWKLGLRAGRGVDVLLTHAPPEGPHAGSDYAHRGCAAITRFIRRFHPKLAVHGHIHEYEGKKIEYQQEGTRVVNAYGYKVVEL